MADIEIEEADYAAHHFYAQGQQWVPESELVAANKEIERLKRAHGQTIAELVETGSMLEKSSAEVERWKSAHDTCCDGGQKLVAEVERLRAELTHRVGWEERCLDAEAALATLRAENARLRAVGDAVIEVGREQLAYWGAAVTLAESFMSLVYFRGGIREWDTPATPAKERWHTAIAETEQASRQIAALLDAS
jgi:hypothetical protein